MQKSEFAIKKIDGRRNERRVEMKNLVLRLIIVLLLLTIYCAVVNLKEKDKFYLKEYYVFEKQTYYQIWKDEMNGISWNNAQEYFKKDNGFLPSEIKDGQTVFIRVKE